MKKITSRLSLLFGVFFALLICTIVFLPLKANASTRYTLGTRAEGQLSEYSEETYDFNLTERKYITFNIKIYNHNLSDVKVSSPNKVYLTKKDFAVSCNLNEDCLVYTASCEFDEGIGTIFLYNKLEVPVAYAIETVVENKIELSKTAITEITNTKHLTMTVKYKPVKKRLGYQIEYSTNSKFKNKTRVNTGATTKNIGKLTKGNIYYVRVRSYARYSDEKLVYSKWSPTQKIKIKK